MAIAYAPGSSDVVLLGSDIPDPGEGKAYELWTITGSTPVSGGCVQPTEGRIAASLSANLDGADRVAVTTESSVCPPAPTAPVVYSAALTT